MIKERLTSFGRCCVCGKVRPEDALVIKHVETGRIICVICITEIAEAE